MLLPAFAMENLANMSTCWFTVESNPVPTAGADAGSDAPVPVEVLDRFDLRTSGASLESILGLS